MTIREKFKRRVVELIHGLPYNEALYKESYEECRGCSGSGYDTNGYSACQICGANGKTWYLRPITIGKVMWCLANKHNERSMTARGDGVMKIDKNITWKLTKENGQEYTDDSQSDECIEKLYNLIK